MWVASQILTLPPALAYSPALAILFNELLKGSISFIIALARSPVLSPDHPQHHLHHYHHPSSSTRHRRLSFLSFLPDTRSSPYPLRSLPPILVVSSLTYSGDHGYPGNWGPSHSDGRQVFRQHSKRVRNFPVNCPVASKFGRPVRF
jgi:hypothetical protein